MLNFMCSIGTGTGTGNWHNIIVFTFDNHRIFSPTCTSISCQPPNRPLNTSTMVFPVTKRMDYANYSDGGPAPCGLDLLSAAIDATSLVSAPQTQPEPAPSSNLGPTPQDQGGDGDEPSAAPETAVALSRNNKRASRPFPDVLRDILSDPENESVVSWLPHGRSFAVHDTYKFSTEVLPKYFRKVVFRSFARKLNRWGFRSVRKSVSGSEATFEHKDFRRDEPELSQVMKCRSNPTATKAKTQASVAAANARAAMKAKAVPAHPAPPQAQAPSPYAPRPVISPSSSSASMAGPVPPIPDAAALVAAASALARSRSNEEFPPVRPAQQRPPSRDALLPGESIAIQALRRAHEEELTVRLRGEHLAVRLREELVLRELRRRAREQEILQLLQVTPSDAVSRYIAEKLQRQLPEQARNRY